MFTEFPKSSVSEILCGHFFLNDIGRTENGLGLHVDTQQEVAYYMTTVRPMILVLCTYDCLP